MEIIIKDLQHIWHPCSQMYDYETFKPLIIKKAKGAYLYTLDGKKIIDAISSWWCKSLGHKHPRLRRALKAQANKFEHVIFANTTNENAVQFTTKITAYTKTLKKVLFASDGSSAIEMALKMSAHSRQISGEIKRTKFAALENSYHGETCLALSVSDCELYNSPYQSLLKQQIFIRDLPYVNSTSEPLWQNCTAYWDKIEIQLNKIKDQLTAIIVEPILQGAGGMKIYSADFLSRLRKWTTQNNIHLIADEIMTGLYRTGLLFACQHANIEPDFMCLAKGLTAGYLPMSIILTNNKIYNHFYGPYELNQTFFHSHTHSGNALAIAVALETLYTMEQENITQQIQITMPLLQQLMQEVAIKTGKLTNVRAIGMMAAADLTTTKPRAGYKVFQTAVKLGAYLRPLENTIYWLPPLNIKQQTLVKLRDITIAAIKNGLR